MTFATITSCVLITRSSRRQKWNDPEIAIVWPIEGEVILSSKDKTGHSLKQVELFP